MLYAQHKNHGDSVSASSIRKAEYACKIWYISLLSSTRTIQGHYKTKLLSFLLVIADPQH